MLTCPFLFDNIQAVDRFQDGSYSHAPGWAESVRHQWYHWNESDTGHPSRASWLSVLLVFLMMITSIPKITLWLPQLLLGSGVKQLP